MCLISKITILLSEPEPRAEEVLITRAEYNDERGTHAAAAAAAAIAPSLAHARRRREV